MFECKKLEYTCMLNNDDQLVETCVTVYTIPTYLPSMIYFTIWKDIKASVHSYKLPFYYAAIFYKTFFLSMQLLFRMIVMLGLILWA